jgi:hypothetical protein
VASSNRKVYMLYELEPSREITGGAWCVSRVRGLLRGRFRSCVLTQRRAAMSAGTQGMSTTASSLPSCARNATSTSSAKSAPHSVRTLLLTPLLYALIHTVHMHTI